MKPSFLDDYPELKKEWDYEQNKKNGLFPEKLSFGSSQRVFWKCGKNNHHKWEASLNNRTKKIKPNCPICCNKKICEVDQCNSLFYSKPELREEWYGDIDEMKKVSLGSMKEIFWKCKKNNHHIWKTSIRNRTGVNKNGCPICSNKIICKIDNCNSLFYTHPELRNEWCGDLEEMKTISFGSHKKVNWKCNQNHKWKTSITNRTCKYKKGCPICNNSKLQSEFNSLIQYYLIKNIQIEQEKRFTDTKNKQKLPYDGFITLNNKHIRVELQGKQHFEKNSFFHKNNSIETRITIDCHKAICAKKANHSLLVISYLCVGSVKNIIGKFINVVSNSSISIFRYYITPQIYMENDTVFVYENKTFSNRKLKIYQVYLYNLECLKKNKVKDFKFNYSCEICDDKFTTRNILFRHYETQKHKKRLKEHKHLLLEKYDNLFSVCLDGTPMLLEK